MNDIDGDLFATTDNPDEQQLKDQIADYHRAQTAVVDEQPAGDGEPPRELRPAAPSAPVVDLAEQPFTWKTLNAIANTEFVPKEYRGKPDRMLGAILYGRESGLGPMTSLQMVDMVDGKPSMSAELMVSLVRRAGHSLIATEWDSTICTAKGKRHDSGDEMEFTFTIEHAQAAGLVRKGSAWERYPHAMLWSRAASQLIRVLFPDVLISMHAYTDEEITS